MSVRDEVAVALEGHAGWQVATALALAETVDAKGAAAAAKELRALMDELVGSKPVPAGKETGLSEFEKRLRARESKAAAARSAAT